MFKRKKSVLCFIALLAFVPLMMVSSSCALFEDSKEAEKDKKKPDRFAFLKSNNKVTKKGENYETMNVEQVIPDIMTISPGFEVKETVYGFIVPGIGKVFGSKNVYDLGNNSRRKSKRENS